MNWIFMNLISWALVIFGVAGPLYIALVLVGLTGFMEVTRFEKHDTLYYRMNPVAKIGLLLAVTVLAATTTWWIGLAAAIILLATYSTLRSGRRKVLLGVLLSLTTTVGATWSFAPRVPVDILPSIGLKGSTILWTFPSYFTNIGYQHVLTLQAIFYGLQISTRITATLLMSLILVMTSTPSSILKAVNKMGVPVAITFMLVVAMRSVSRIFQAIDVSVKVQRMRGLGSGAPRFLRPIYFVKGALSSIVPVIVFLFRGANNTSLSADTRAFRAYPKRTYLDPIVFTRTDYTCFLIVALVIILSVVANISGYGRGLPYIV